MHLMSLSRFLESHNTGKITEMNFFPLSAAEMKWPEVTTAILHYEQLIDKIVFWQDWVSEQPNKY